MSRKEDAFVFGLLARGILAPVREYRFAAMSCGGTGPGVRARLEAANLSDWRFDFAWPAVQVAVEVEGGVWSGGRHVRPAGFLEDVRKYNIAAMMGWTVLRATGDPEADRLVFDYLTSVELEGGDE